ncbi:MAG: hypothetical protein HYW62_02180 [Candidatus Levybacteria bacterium]|nr:hypothetical protein [Candidatus Levybacteria bacterium]
METESADPKMEIAKIDYDLAFPGILPDNPLYKLKVLRDKISIVLISDQYKRIEFYLLQADKGILATAMLIDKNKVALAEQTALKAEHNMTLVTYELKKMSEKPNDDLFNKLKTASRKHQEVLGTLIERVPAQNQKTFIIVVNFSKTNLQTIEKLQNKKYYNKQ